MNKTPKIAFMTTRCDHYNLKLFELLAQKYEVHFYLTGGGDHFRVKENPALVGNFKTYHLKKYSFGRFDFIPGLFQLLFRRYDIFIKTIDGRFALPASFFISRVKRTPFLLWAGLWQHPQSLFHKISFVLTKYIYKTCEANIVYGKHVEQYLLNLGVDERKIFCEHHAVDNELFGKTIDQQDKKALKDQLGIDHEKVVLYVGRLENSKGLNYLIEAVKDIHVPVFLVFVGTGEQEEYLKNECQKHRIKSNFCGYIPNAQLPLYYAVADIFVLPSITTKDFKEPWGLVINEAMNQGVPIVATDAVGAAAGGLVRHGENGYVVPEKNSVALKEALAILLTNEDKRQSMGKRSKEFISSWNHKRALEDFSKGIEYVLKKKQILSEE